MFDFSSFRSPSGLNHHPGLKDFVNGILSSSDWNYWDALSLTGNDVQEASYDMIMDNPEDVMYGVNKVEMVFGQRYFGLFDSLVIKHSDSGNMILHFYTTVRSASAVLVLFNKLMSLLGKGTYAEPWLTFHNKELVQAFAINDVNDPDQVIGHIWIHGNYSFNIGYRSNPPHQLVFTVAKTFKKEVKFFSRRKGTLISILRYSIDDILTLRELSAEPFYENEKVKYIDYTFALDQPELGLFDRARVRIFDTEKRADKGPFHITYYSRFEVKAAEVITFSDQIFKIYGSDGGGDRELVPYEIDRIEAYLRWQGRSWWINNGHSIKNFEDEEDKVLYWLYFDLDPDENGFALHVVGFNDMLAYHQEHFGNI